MASYTLWDIDDTFWFRVKRMCKIRKKSIKDIIMENLWRELKEFEVKHPYHAVHIYE